MKEVAGVTLIGFAAGMLGTGLGGLLAVLLTAPGRSWLGALLGFSAGIMLAVIAFDLMPEALSVGGLWVSVAGLVLGAGLIALIDLTVPHRHLSGSRRDSVRLLRLGVVMGLGIALHNLPEGLAIGAGFAHDEALGLALAAAIALQNLPEGMAMGLPLSVSGRPGHVVVASTALTGFPMGVGAALGATVGNVSPNLLALALSFAAGAMLFITADELIPDAHEMGEGHAATAGIVVGVIAGIILLSAIGA